jgi:hypothetical protein
MAIALVNHTKVTPSGSSGGTSPAINTTGSNCIIIGQVRADTESAGVSDNQGNTYTAITFYHPSFIGVELYYCISPTTSASHTFTTSKQNSSMCIAAFSGVKTTSPLNIDIGASNNNSSTTIQPGSATPSEANELIITVFGSAHTSTVSIDSSFTITDQVAFVSGQSYGSALAYIVQGAASAVNPTWTATASGTIDAKAVAMSSFKSSSVDANVNLTGASATAAVGSLGYTLDASPTLSGVQAAAAAGLFSLGVDSTVGLDGISATGFAGTLAVSASVDISLSGVQAIGIVGDLAATLEYLTVPLITIMSDNPLPVSSSMVDDNVPVEADMPSQIAFESVINTNPIPMTGTMTAVPVPGEGSVP